MSNRNYDPKLSQAGFMDLVCAIQERLETPDGSKCLGAMSGAQRDAARRLVEAAKAYVDVVEGRADRTPTEPPTAEEVGMAWWNGLDEVQRKYWM